LQSSDACTIARSPSLDGSGLAHAARLRSRSTCGLWPRKRRCAQPMLSCLACSETALLTGAPWHCCTALSCRRMHAAWPGCIASRCSLGAPVLHQCDAQGDSCTVSVACCLPRVALFASVATGTDPKAVQHKRESARLTSQPTHCALPAHVSTCVIVHLSADACSLSCRRAHSKGAKEQAQWAASCRSLHIASAPID
jgi:hypothetical protein